MKKKIFLYFIALLPFTISCKKAIEEKKLDILIEAITNGSWLITQYLDESLDVTNEFTGYEFSFTEDNKVKAAFNGQQTVGTWTGNLTEYSITSEFPVSTNPLARLNGKWVVSESDYNYVKASRTIDGKTYTLEMTKKM